MVMELDVGERLSAIDVCLRQNPAPHDDRRIPACVANIRERVSFQQHQVGPLADLDRAVYSLVLAIGPD